MTATLLGRLFIVPAVIVCVLLGVAVVVVFFGASPMEKPRTIEELLTIVESDSGDRTAGVMLLPAAKESWQAAQELARRLERIDDDAEMSPRRRGEISTRIISTLDGMLAETTPTDVARSKRNFLIVALSMVETPGAVEWLTARLSSEDAEIRRIALQGLAGMQIGEAREALPQIYPLLRDQVREVQMVACLAVASLAQPGDRTAIRELATVEAPHPELEWNKTIALARLGSTRGKLMLLNMLDRQYWERFQLDYVEEGTQVRRGFSDAEVNDRLVATAEVAGYVDDAEVETLLQKLRDEDPSPLVRTAARTALERAEASPDQRSTSSIHAGVTRPSA